MDEPYLPEEMDLVSLDHASEGVYGIQEAGPHVVRIHPPRVCEGEFCPFHNPSEHHMRTWPMNWRGDRGLLERLCPHGTGHPDPDSADFHKRTGNDYMNVHGCDGCCTPTTGKHRADLICSGCEKGQHDRCEAMWDMLAVCQCWCREEMGS